MNKIKYLGLIPARKGSKGILHKNLKPLKGKPLIQYTFEAAKSSLKLDAVHLTTDSEEIIALAKENSIEAPYIRPDYLASDTTPMIDTVLYHLNWLQENCNVEVEHVVLLQPTNPIRLKGLIDQCMNAYEKGGEDSLVTVTECLQHPYETFTMQLNGRAKFLVPDLPSRRQDYPEFFFISGSIYIASKAFLEKNRKFFDDTTQCYRTSREEGIDIDDMFTFRIAESLLVQHSD